MRTIVVTLFILSLISVNISSLVFAQNFNAGYQKYTRGDFKGAEESLKAASKAKGGDKAQIYKYLGISQYMLGKKGQSKDSLKKALSINPNTNIVSSEVLDESILAFFANLKKDAKPSTQAPVARKEPPKPQGIVNNTRSTAVQPQMSKFGKPTKTTYLMVNSNASNASVTLDGILSGTVGSLIEADAGQSLVEVESPGYQTRKIRLNIVANRENTITVNLEKSKPKAPPVAKVKTPKNDVAKAKKDMPSNLPDPGNDLFGDGPDAEGAAGGRDLAAEFSADTTKAQIPAPVPRKPPPPQMQPVPARPPAGSSAALAPAAAADVKKSIMQKKQVMPEPKPGYSAPNPNYIPPPAYAQSQPQQPYPYAQQPQVPQTQGQYYYDPNNPNMPQPMPVQPAAPSQQQGYAQPYAPPQPPPPPSSVQAQGPIIYNNPYQAPVKQNKTRPRSSTSKSMAARKTSSTTSGSMFVALLPFGAGQFQNESYFLGVAFAGAEIGSLYWWYKSKTDADTAVRTAEEYFDDTNNSEEDKKTFENDTNDFVDSRRQQQNYALYSFGALYVIGVVEAIVNMPTERTGLKKSRGPSKRRYGLLRSHDYEHALTMTQRFSYLPSSYQVGVIEVPADFQTRPQDKPIVGLKLGWEF